MIFNFDLLICLLLVLVFVLMFLVCQFVADNVLVDVSDVILVVFVEESLVIIVFNGMDSMVIDLVNWLEGCFGVECDLEIEVFIVDLVLCMIVEEKVG